MSTRSRKLINQPQNIVGEMLEGYVAAYPDILQLTAERLVVRRVPKAAGKVGLVIGNGSGHEPAMIGFVGAGLFDVNVPGPIFAAPPPARLLQGIRAAERGAGVLVCVSHHAGDLMTAEVALAQAAKAGLRDVEMVVLYDDVASAPRGSEAERRGTAGLFFTWKMLGAFAETGASLAECKALAEKVRDCHPDAQHGAHLMLPPRHRRAHVRDGRRRDGDRHGRARRSGRGPHARAQRR